MKGLYKPLVAVLVLWCNFSVAQRTITGTVTSSTDSLPLAGAIIQAEGTNVGTASDSNGTYTLTVDTQVKNLVFSYIGLKRRVIAIGDNTVINVVLEPDLNTFDEVVVTALAIKREQRSLGFSTTT